MEDTELQLQMRSRIRRHMLTVIGGVVAAVVGMAVVAGVVRAASGGEKPGLAAIFPALAILAIPGIGFWSTFTNLRCPSCNGLVAWQVSFKYSAFGGMTANECRHCGKTIFSPNTPERFRRMVLVMVGVGAALAILGAIASIASQQHP